MGGGVLQSGLLLRASCLGGIVWVLDSLCCSLGFVRLFGFYVRLFFFGLARWGASGPLIGDPTAEDFSTPSARLVVQGLSFFGGRIQKMAST